MTSEHVDGPEILAVLAALRAQPHHAPLHPGQIRIQSGVNLTGRGDLMDILLSHPRVTDHGGSLSYNPIVKDVHSSLDLMKRLREVPNLDL
jgi:hypothetical protein